MRIRPAPIHRQHQRLILDRPRDRKRPPMPRTRRRPVRPQHDHLRPTPQSLSKQLRKPKVIANRRTHHGLIRTDPRAVRHNAITTRKKLALPTETKRMHLHILTDHIPVWSNHSRQVPPTPVRTINNCPRTMNSHTEPTRKPLQIPKRPPITVGRPFRPKTKTRIKHLAKHNQITSANINPRQHLVRQRKVPLPILPQQIPLHQMRPPTPRAITSSTTPIRLLHHHHHHQALRTTNNTNINNTAKPPDSTNQAINKSTQHQSSVPPSPKPPPKQATGQISTATTTTTRNPRKQWGGQVPGGGPGKWDRVSGNGQEGRDKRGEEVGREGCGGRGGRRGRGVQENQTISQELHRPGVSPKGQRPTHHRNPHPPPQNNLSAHPNPGGPSPPKHQTLTNPTQPTPTTPKSPAKPCTPPPSNPPQDPLAPGTHQTDHFLTNPMHHSPPPTVSAGVRSADNQTSTPTPPHTASPASHNQYHHQQQPSPTQSRTTRTGT